MESVVCNHLIRLMFNMEPSPQFDYATKLFYWESGKRREVDFVGKFEGAFLPIEVKYQGSIRRNDLYGMIDFMKGGRSRRGIIITKDALGQGRNHTEVPLPIFLLMS